VTRLQCRNNRQTVSASKHLSRFLFNLIIAFGEKTEFPLNTPMASSQIFTIETLHNLRKSLCGFLTQQKAGVTAVAVERSIEQNVRDTAVLLRNG
jgi:hypothetical protein